jgi:hypothetical protein
MDIINNIPLYVMELAVLITSVIGVKIYNKAILPYKLLCIQVMCGLIIEIIGHIFIYRHQPALNTICHNFYTIAEFYLMYAAGVIILNKYKRIFWGISVLPLVVWIVHVCRLGIDNFSNYSFILGGLLLVILFVLLLYQTTKSVPILKYSPDFWICIGIIVYFGCNVPFFSLFAYFTSHGKEKMGAKLFILNDFLALTRYLCFGIAFLLLNSKKRPNGHSF